jgi:hypothetical protein
MNAEEARELFSEAFEGELDEERKRAFEEQLEKDEALREEYRVFVETFQIVSRFGDDDDAPKLLPKVQERLRKRSKGRFYRDRFSQQTGPSWLLPLLAVMALLIVGAVAWYVMQSVVIVETTASDTPESQRE